MEKSKNTESKKPFWQPVVITMSLLILLLVGNSTKYSSWTNAADAPPTEEVKVPIVLPDAPKAIIDPIIVENCQTQLAAYADPEFTKYALFMESNFKNKSTTSSLMNLAIARYDQFKGDIYGQYNLLIGTATALGGAAGTSSADLGSGLEKCNTLAEKYIADAAKLLSNRAISTSSIKKTSIFVEKYLQINNKLRTLNLDIMRMVVNVSSFQQKLPCYLKKCV